MACVETRSAELRSSTKTKIRLEDIFIYNKRKLAERGVNDAKQFAKIVHAYRARESRRRDKELEAHEPPPLIRQNLVYYTPSVREADSPRKKQGKRHVTKA